MCTLWPPLHSPFRSRFPSSAPHLTRAAPNPAHLRPHKPFAQRLPAASKRAPAALFPPPARFPAWGLDSNSPMLWLCRLSSSSPPLFQSSAPAAAASDTPPRRAGGACRFPTLRFPPAHRARTGAPCFVPPQALFPDSFRTHPCPVLGALTPATAVPACSFPDCIARPGLTLHGHQRMIHTRSHARPTPCHAALLPAFPPAELTCRLSRVLSCGRRLKRLPLHVRIQHHVALCLSSVMPSPPLIHLSHPSPRTRTKPLHNPSLYRVWSTPHPAMLAPPARHALLFHGLVRHACTSLSCL